jgi:hypothetical protein
MGYQHARIFRSDAKSFEPAELQAPRHHVHEHPRGSEEAREHPDDDKRFFREVTKPLEGVVAAYAKEYFEAHDRPHQPAP